MLPYTYSENPNYFYYADTYNRYILGQKSKSRNQPLICFGINPSKATPENSDRTISTINNMSNHFGYDGWVMFNIYPQRNTYQSDLDKICNQVIHQKNIEVIKSFFNSLLEVYPQIDVLCAWGAGIKGRSYLATCLQDINKSLNGKIIYKCLNVSKTGHPHHPLYVSYNTMNELEDFDLSEYLNKF